MAAQILYKLTINCTKLSICFLYVRIFHHIKWFRILVYGVIVLVGTYALGSIIATVITCLPVARYWERTIPGTCFNVEIFWVVNAFVFIAEDVITLCLPVPVLRKLQVPRRQKYGLCLLLSVGVL